MADYTLVAHQAAKIDVSTSGDTITLDSRFVWTFRHDGVTTAGAADTNAIFLAKGSSPAATHAGSLDKGALVYGSTVSYGPGVTTVYAKAAAGAPTMTVAPSRPG